VLSIVRNAAISGISLLMQAHSLDNPMSDKRQDEPPTDEQLLCVLQSSPYTQQSTS